MKAASFLLFLLLMSCSTNSERQPAAAGNGTCIDLASSFFNQKRGIDQGPDWPSVLEKFEISQSEIDEILVSPYFRTHIFKNESAGMSQDSALILLMLKKTRPDLSDNRIWMRYNRLFHMCGL